MPSLSKILRTAAISIMLTASLTACQPNVELVPATAEQRASLERLRKNCITASPGKEGKMYNLGELRHKQRIFTCDEMKELCVSDYEGEMCKGMMTVASVENAVEKACRSRGQASRSATCTKITSACNGKGFTSPECSSAIAQFNR